jgi:hypothetical protein
MSGFRDIVDWETFSHPIMRPQHKGHVNISLVASQRYLRKPTVILAGASMQPQPRPVSVQAKRFEQFNEISKEEEECYLSELLKVFTTI